MRFFILRHEYPDAGYIDADVSFFPPLETYYRQGSEFERGVTSISLTMDKTIRELRVDFFLTTCGAMFASSQLAHELKSCQPDLLTMPVSSKYSNNRPTEKSYYLVHANRKLDCFDYGRSEYSGKALMLQRRERGEVLPLAKGVQSLVIDPHKAEGGHFFFVDNVLLIDPVISETVVAAITAQRFIVRFDVLAE